MRAYPRLTLQMAMAASSLALACGGSTEVQSPPNSLTLSAYDVGTYAGGDTTLPTVTLRDALDREVSGSVRWTSLDTSIATVLGTRLYGRSVGSTSLIATSASGTASGTVHVRVTPEPVLNISSNIYGSTIFGNDSLVAHAWAIGPKGDSLGDRAVTLSALTPAVATITDAGVIRAHQDGIALFRASTESFAETIPLTVFVTRVARITVNADTVRMYAGEESAPIHFSALDANGHVMVGVDFAVVSSDPSIVNFDRSQSPTSLVANNVGTALITARADTVSTTVTVVVVPTP